MSIACEGCGREIEADMRYCPYCGREGGRDLAVWQATPQTTAGMPGYPPGPQMSPFPGVYPMYPMPYPYYGGMGISGGRILGVIGAVILLIDGILAGMMGTALVIFAEDLAVGSALVVGCALAIASCVSVLSAKLPVLSLLGPFALVAAGIMVTGPFDAPEVGIIGTFLAILSLVFIILGFKDLRTRAEMRYNMPAFVPPYMAPPPYGGGPGARPPGV